MAGDEKGHQLVDETFVRESARFDCYRENIPSTSFPLGGQFRFLLLYKGVACLFDDLRSRLEVIITFDSILELAMLQNTNPGILTARTSSAKGRS